MDRGIFKGSHKTFSGLILTLNANCLLPAWAIQQMLRFGYRRHPRQALIRVLAVGGGKSVPKWHYLYNKEQKHKGPYNLQL